MVIMTIIALSEKCGDGETDIERQRRPLERVFYGCYARVLKISKRRFGLPSFEQEQRFAATAGWLGTVEEDSEGVRWRA